nr:pilus assembly protein [Acidithiobacillus ferruginosus]
MLACPEGASAVEFAITAPAPLLALLGMFRVARLCSGPRPNGTLPDSLRSGNAAPPICSRLSLKRPDAGGGCHVGWSW